MLISEIINKKKFGKTISVKEINRFVQAINDWSISDAEIAAFSMASLINGLSIEETTNLTTALIKSGVIMDWESVAGDLPVTDIYSSLSVGNKINFIATPILACCGCCVPKIGISNMVNYSGYGTLDKIACIRGYNHSPSLHHIKKVMKKTRCVIMGPNEEFAPVERRFHAIRCMISANNSPAFSTASILSRNISAGIENLVFNVNVGRGSLYKDMSIALKLSEYITSVASNFNFPLKIIYSNSDYIIGRNVGNSLEIIEIIEYFKSSPENRDKTIHDIVLKVVSEALILSKIAKDYDEAHQKIERALISGMALDIFGDMIFNLGGPADFTEFPEAYLYKSKYVKEIKSNEKGYICDIDPFVVGQETRNLTKQSDGFNHGAGFSEIIPLGSFVEKDDIIAYVHGNDIELMENAKKNFIASLKISNTKPILPPLFLGVDKS